MRYFALIMLHWLDFDLCRACSAPVRNRQNIEQIEREIEDWKLVLLRCERPLI